MTSYRIEVRRDTSANWAVANPVLLAGEPAYETDTNQLKVGDGVNPYLDLPFAGAAITDGTTITGVVPYSSLPVGTTSTTVAAGNDSRFTNARTPTAHATTHADGGTDEVTIAQSQVTGLVTDLDAKVDAVDFPAKGALLVGTGTGTYAALTVGANGQAVVADSTQLAGVKFGTPGLVVTQTFSWSGPITVMPYTFRWYNDTAQTLAIDVVRASLGVAPTGSSAIFDVLKNGTTIFPTTSNRPAIAASAFTDLSGTPDVTTVDPGDYLTIATVQIGSTVPGSDLTVTILMH